MQPHHSLVSSFVGAIKSQDSLAVFESGLVTIVSFGVTHQLVEHRKIHVLQAFPLKQAPVLVPTFKQVASIESHGFSQRTCLVFFKVIANSFLYLDKCALDRKSVV